MQLYLSTKLCDLKERFDFESGFFVAETNATWVIFSTRRKKLLWLLLRKEATPYKKAGAGQSLKDVIYLAILTILHSLIV